MIRRHLLVLGLLMLSACAGHEDTYYRNTQAIDRLAISPPEELRDTVNIPVVGVTIDFQGTNGWTSTKNRTNEFQYFKYIEKDRLHTAVIRVYPVFPPRAEFKDLNDFYNYTKPNLELLRDKNGNDIEFIVSASSEKAPLCTSLHKKTRTKDEKHAPGKLLVHDGYEYICKHPYRPRVFVNLHYSERFALADNIADVQSRAEMMFKRITFSE